MRLFKRVAIAFAVVGQNAVAQAQSRPPDIAAQLAKFPFPMGDSATRAALAKSLQQLEAGQCWQASKDQLTLTYCSPGKYGKGDLLALHLDQPSVTIASLARELGDAAVFASPVAFFAPSSPIVIPNVAQLPGLLGPRAVAALPPAKRGSLTIASKTFAARFGAGGIAKIGLTKLGLPASDVFAMVEYPATGGPAKTVRLWVDNWDRPMNLQDARFTNSTVLVTTDSGGIRSTLAWGTFQLGTRAPITAALGSVDGEPTVFGFGARSITADLYSDLVLALPLFTAATRPSFKAAASTLPLGLLEIDNVQFQPYTPGADAPSWSTFTVLFAADGSKIPTEGGLQGPITVLNGTAMLAGHSLANFHARSTPAEGTTISGDVSISLGGGILKDIQARYDASLSGTSAATAAMTLSGGFLLGSAQAGNSTVSFDNSKALVSFGMPGCSGLRLEAKLDVSSIATDIAGPLGSALANSVKSLNPMACAGDAMQAIMLAKGPVLAAASISERWVNGASRQVADRVAGGWDAAKSSVSGLLQSHKRSRPECKDIADVYSCKTNEMVKACTATDPKAGLVYDPNSGDCWRIGHQFLYRAGRCLHLFPGHSRPDSVDGFGRRYPQSPDPSLVGMADCSGDWRQAWRFFDGQVINATDLRLTAEKSGSGAETGRITADGPYPGSPAQQWAIDGLGILRGQNRCVVPTAGQPVALGSCSDPDARGWMAISPTLQWHPGTSVVRFGAGGRCLDIKDNGRRAGTAVQLWDCNDADWNKRWVHEGGVLRNPESNLCLAPAGAGNAGDPIVIGQCDESGSRAQWRYTTDGPQAGQFQNQAMYACLTTMGTNNGAALILANCNPAATWDQYWIKIP